LPTLVISVILIIVFLLDVKWYLILVFHYSLDFHSLITNNAEQLLLYLLAMLFCPIYPLSNNKTIDFNLCQVEYSLAQKFTMIYHITLRLKSKSPWCYNLPLLYKFTCFILRCRSGPPFIKAEIISFLLP
jgi:hypothetical protein